MQQKITPNLWFDGNAKLAADFYTSVFPKSSMGSVSYYPGSTEEGLADFQKDFAGKELTIAFDLAGHNFVAINAAPEFKPTPANSCFVYFNPDEDSEAREHMDQVWAQLADGGTALMPLQKYDFSDYYGWVQDRYGFSWQLMLNVPKQSNFPSIVPSLLFSGNAQNKAGEALEFYKSVFENARPGFVSHYQAPAGVATTDSIAYGDIELVPGEWLAVMDDGSGGNSAFSEAVSYSIACKDQAEIDYFWEKLSSIPEAEQCGWCKDKYGVSWQVVPENMAELMKHPDAFTHMMQMKKLVISDF